MAKKADWVAKAKRIIAEGDKAVAIAERSLGAARAAYWTKLSDVFIAAQKSDPSLSARKIAKAIGKSNVWVSHVLRWRSTGGSTVNINSTPWSGLNRGVTTERSRARKVMREQPSVIAAEATKLPPAKRRKFMAALSKAGLRTPEDDAPAPRRTAGSNVVAFPRGAGGKAYMADLAARTKRSEAEWRASAPARARQQAEDDAYENSPQAATDIAVLHCEAATQIATSFADGVDLKAGTLRHSERRVLQQLVSALTRAVERGKAALAVATAALESVTKERTSAKNNTRKVRA